MAGLKLGGNPFAADDYKNYHNYPFFEHYPTISSDTHGMLFSDSVKGLVSWRPATVQ